MRVQRISEGIMKRRSGWKSGWNSHKVTSAARCASSSKRRNDKARTLERETPALFNPCLSPLVSCHARISRYNVIHTRDPFHHRVARTTLSRTSKSLKIIESGSERGVTTGQSSYFNIFLHAGHPDVVHIPSINIKWNAFANISIDEHKFWIYAFIIVRRIYIKIKGLIIMKLIL